MGKVTIRPSFFCDIQLIAEHARQADIDEIKASSGHTVQQSLSYGLAHSSPCWTILMGDVPVSMCGAIQSPKYQDCAVVWMISTEAAADHPLSFYKASKKVLSRIHEKYNCIANYVDSRNDLAVRFLGKLGFTLEGPVVNGLGDVPFHKFFKVRQYV